MGRKKKTVAPTLDIFAVEVDGEVRSMVSLSNLAAWLKGDKDPKKKYDQATMDVLAKFMLEQDKSLLAEAKKHEVDVHSTFNGDEE